MNARKLRVGALFAGYGGIELALAQVFGDDIELVWYAEIEPGPAAVMAHHFPGVPNLGDVTKVDWSTVPPVDIITGGSPCQDLSHAGKRLGMRPGTRSGLWASMHDAIDIIRPQLVIWENVRGALSAAADSAMEQCPGCLGDGRDEPSLRALGRVLGDLADIGFDARWYGLPAAAVGAAHGRFRVFLFATPGHAEGVGVEGVGAGRVGLSSALARARLPHGASATAGGRRVAPLLPTPTSSDTNGAGAHGDGGADLRTTVSLLPTPTAMDALGSRNATAYRDPDAGPHNSGTTLTDVAWQLEDYTDPRLLPTPTTQPTTGNGHARNLGGEVQSLLPTPRATRGGSGTEILYGLGGERSDDERAQGAVLLPTPRATDGTKGGPNQRGSSGDLMLPSAVRQSAQDWRQYAAAIRRAEITTGRPAPAPTETGAKGQPRLSPAFVEWLMMLPAGHVTDPEIGLTRNEQLKALGNGVVPAQAAAALLAFIADESAVAA